MKSLYYRYHVTFACGHKNTAYTSRKLFADQEITTEHSCPRCQTGVKMNRKMTKVGDPAQVSILPMLDLDGDRKSIYMVIVKSISRGEWIVSHDAYHPLHALWIVNSFYKDVEYIEPQEIPNLIAA